MPSALKASKVFKVGSKRLVPAAGAPDYRFGVTGAIRSALQWPFSAGSAWNTPIGAGASLSAAPVTFIESGTNSGGFATRLRPEKERIYMNPGAATQLIQFNCYGWGGQPGCSEVDRVNASTGGTWGGAPWFTSFNVPADSSFSVPNDGGNDCAAFVTADSANVDQVQPLCHAGSDFTAQVKFSRVSITGAGESGSHGGSNLSALGGTIRYGEISNAVLHGLTYLSHALKCNIDAHRFYYYSHTPGYVWPATTRDGYASPSTYGGSNANVVPGALFTLQSSFNTAVGGGNVTTQLGSILAETIKRFGIYAVDDTTWNAIAIAVEEGPAGSATSEWLGLNAGYTLDYDPASLAGGNALYQDMRNVFGALYVVTNNGSGSVGGGGSPAYSTPAPPPF